MNFGTPCMKIFRNRINATFMRSNDSGTILESTDFISWKILRVVIFGTPCIYLFIFFEIQSIITFIWGNDSVPFSKQQIFSSLWKILRFLNFGTPCINFFLNPINTTLMQSNDSVALSRHQISYRNYFVYFLNFGTPCITCIAYTSSSRLAVKTHLCGSFWACNHGYLSSAV